MTKNMRVFFIFIPLIVLISVITGYIYFLKHINSLKVNTESNIKAIAVLTGDKGRIELGVQMLEKNLDAKLFISGVYKKSNLNNIISKKNMQNRISIDKISESTIENAKEIILWAKSNSFKEISVITSYYHMPRSILLLNHYESDIKYNQYPVQKKNYNNSNFTNVIKKNFFLYEEFFKFVVTYILIKI
tara:strand:- start:117 stop:683 length:567 start_codon:yes stop_codon:yes gene_type:complete